jgi:hypothetical protein
MKTAILQDENDLSSAEKCYYGNVQPMRINRVHQVERLGDGAQRCASVAGIRISHVTEQQHYEKGNCDHRRRVCRYQPDKATGERAGFPGNIGGQE